MSDDMVEAMQHEADEGERLLHHSARVQQDEAPFGSGQLDDNEVDALGRTRIARWSPREEAAWEQPPEGGIEAP